MDSPTELHDHPNPLTCTPQLSPQKAPPIDSPYIMKEDDKVGKKLTPTVKAFENAHFLHGGEARILRVLCEFQEPAARLSAHDVRGTVLFFGSARSMSKGQFDITLANLEQQLHKPGFDKESVQAKIDSFKKVEWMCPYVDVTEELARRLTEWTVSNERLQELNTRCTNYLTGEVHEAGKIAQPLVVTTGGGPGIMEAANKGAAAVLGANTMGMGISLPFEKGLNPYVTKGLAFEFHYFFTRKFWMMYSAQALIVGPGGFGTMDELFELLTLRQTGKVEDLPIVLLGAKYWKTIINWQAMADFGTISQREVDKLCFADDADTAFDYLTAQIMRNAEERAKHVYR